MIRAKFNVQSITKHFGGGVTVKLQPVTTGSEENKNFWKYTPSGELTMNIHGEASDMFNVGQEFYLDFTPASEAAPGA